MTFSEYHNRWHRKLVLATELISAFSDMRTLLDSIGVEIEMICGWRGEKDQLEAFNNGFSKQKFGGSPHNFGCAFDLVEVKDGKPNWSTDEATWAKIGMAGEKYGLTWGCDWDGDTITNDKDDTPGSKFDDRPHFQVKDWRKKYTELFHTEPPIG